MSCSDIAGMQTGGGGDDQPQPMEVDTSEDETSHGSNGVTNIEQGNFLLSSSKLHDITHLQILSSVK